MARLTVDQAASLGNQLTGLPANFVKALILLEGSWGSGNWHNGEIVNNPFDVTSDWARQAGYGANVTGQGGSQGNIAFFDDPEAAVRAWAQGINTFRNYAGLRADLASGAGANVLASDLAGAGYAGNSSTFASSLVTIFFNLGGGVFRPGEVAPAGKQNPPFIPNPLANVGLPPLQLPTLPAVPGVSDVTSGLSSVATTLSELPNKLSAPFVDFLNQTKAVGDFLGQPNLLARVLLLFGGVLVAIVGLILFAASFVHLPGGAGVG